MSASCISILLINKKEANMIAIIIATRTRNLKMQGYPMKWNVVNTKCVPFMV